MLRRLWLAAFVVLGAVGSTSAQDRAPADDATVWRKVGAQADAPAKQAAEPPDALPNVIRQARRDAAVAPASAEEPAAKPLARITSGSSGMTLPNDAGQVWREYDISSYTARVTTTKRPEQAVVDWILRETGYEAWHTEPLGILSAGPRTLRVYHTPQMQQIVADLVDRFVSSEAATYTFSLRVLTLDSPSWRSTAQRLLRPIPVQTPGMNAWVLAKEDAAIVLGELRRRNDYREHSSPYLMVNNGQSTLVSAMRARSYVRDVILRPETAAGFDPSPGQVDEGFNLDFSPLLSVDRRMIDATIRCDVDQIEKMIPVMLDVPTQALPRQRTKIEVPQITHYRFHERFRWPIDQMLVVGMGMVALPIPVDGAPMVPGVPLPIGTTPARADLLVFVECKGATATAATSSGAAHGGRSSQRDARNYRGRY